MSNLIRGGVPGGVLEGELRLGGDFFLSCEMQTMQRLFGLGPIFTPQQLTDGGVGGGVHGVEPPLHARGDCRGAGVGGGDGCDVCSKDLSPLTESSHSHWFRPHSGQPYSTSKRDLNFSSSFLFSSKASQSSSSFTTTCSLRFLLETNASSTFARRFHSL